jgi:WD40 repeat protein
MYDITLCSQYENGSPNGVNTSSEVYNSFAAVGHDDGSVSIWNINMRQMVAHYKMHDQQVRGVTYSPDGQYVASASHDSNVHITDLGSGKVVKTLDGHRDKVVSVKWHHQRPLILSTSADKTARIWYPKFSYQP